MPLVYSDGGGGWRGYLALPAGASQDPQDTVPGSW
jgi:hypothetical protein